MHCNSAQQAPIKPCREGKQRLWWPAHCVGLAEGATATETEAGVLQRVRVMCVACIRWHFVLLVQRAVCS